MHMEIKRNVSTSFNIFPGWRLAVSRKGFNLGTPKNSNPIYSGLYSVIFSVYPNKILNLRKIIVNIPAARNISNTRKVHLFSASAVQRWYLSDLGSCTVAATASLPACVRPILILCYIARVWALLPVKVSPLIQSFLRRSSSIVICEVESKTLI